jgi:hypothetical protein
MSILYRNQALRMHGVLNLNPWFQLGVGLRLVAQSELFKMALQSSDINSQQLKTTSALCIFWVSLQLKLSFMMSGLVLCEKRLFPTAKRKVHMALTTSTGGQR